MSYIKKDQVQERNMVRKEDTMKTKNKKRREGRTFFQKMCSMILAIALIMTLLPSAIFAETTLPFSDVNPSAWYFKDVKNAYEKGLINGKSPTRYAPDDQMTYAEAVKLAACMYQQKKEGGITLKNGNPWYLPYVQYAQANALISETLPWNQAATRAGYMSIFANVLPDSESSKNNIPDASIPDVPTTHPNAAAIYKLYRAGIVTGVDAQHNCKPLANIKRSEVAAILTRMTDASARVAFDMGGGSTTMTEPLRIIEQPQAVVDKLGAAAILRVKATGGKGKLKYQWRSAPEGSNDFKNSAYPGNETDALGAKVEDTAYQYHCIVQDEAGTQVVSIAVLVKKAPDAVEPLKITEQPQSIVDTVGSDAVLKVVATGGKGKLKYQWRRSEQKDGVFENTDYPGKTDNELHAKVENKQYFYHCVVSDEAGTTVTSDVVNVTKLNSFSEIIKPKDPIIKPIVMMIIKQPPEYVLIDTVNTKHELSLLCTGMNLKYQWQAKALMGDNWIDITGFPNKVGTQTDTLTLSTTLDFTDGEEYRCIISDGTKQIISNVSRVFYFPKQTAGGRPPVILYTKKTIDGKDNTERTFSVSAYGVYGDTLKYRWQYFAHNLNEWYDENDRVEEHIMVIGQKTDTIRIIVSDEFYFSLKYRCIVSDQNGNEVIQEFTP